LLSVAAVVIAPEWQNLPNGCSTVNRSVAVLHALSVPVPGGRIAVHEHGTGTPIVFLHGGTGTAAVDWGEIADRLASRYRTIVFDLRGHGRSPHEGAEFGIVRFGLDTLHVMRALGLARAALVGFSVGGNTLLGLLARDARPALALVTIGASARGEPARVQEIMAGGWPSYLTELEHTVGTGPEYWRELRGMLAHDWARNVSFSDEELRRITCPVLVCHGTGDRVQRVDYAEHLAAELPDAELFLVEGAGHAVQLEQPDLFVERVQEFLERALRRP
jgi:pimeloyl-ACP methyl ester carboxylesterase